MRFRLLAVLIPVLLLLSTLLFLTTTFAPTLAHSYTTLDSMPYGVTLESKNPNSQTDASMQWIKATGMGWTRLQEHWDMEETAPGSYDFSAAIPQVALSIQYGMKIDWALQKPPSWDVQSNCGSVPQAQPMANYAVAVFKQFGAQISSFEIGNEEWAWDSNQACRTPQNYIPVLETVASALRAAHYTGLIGMWGYTNYSSVQQITDWFKGFLSDPSNPGSYLDYFNFHFYHAGQDPNVPLTSHPAFMDVVNTINSVAKLYNHGDKPSWVTEYGYNTNCNNDPGCNLVTPDQQAQYEKEILEDGRTSGGLLDHAFVYTLIPGVQEKSIYQGGVALPAATMEASEAAQYPSWR